MIPPPALAWIVGPDTGLSSRAIWATMAGVRDGPKDHPLDPADLGRCLRLLDAVPEWHPRIGEMASVSPQWAALVARWGDLRAAMVADVGLRWEKGRAAPGTYTLMKQILGGAT